MKVVVNKFKTAILERHGINQPYFPESETTFSISAEEHPDWFEISVYGATEQEIAYLKTKYEWLGKFEVNIKY